MVTVDIFNSCLGHQVNKLFEKDDVIGLPKFEFLVEPQRLTLIVLTPCKIVLPVPCHSFSTFGLTLQCVKVFAFVNFVIVDTLPFEMCYFIHPSSHALLYKQQSPFGAKICKDIFPRILSVPRSEFSESVARGKL